MIFIQRHGDVGNIAFSGDEARLLRNGNVVVDWTTGGAINNVPQEGGYVLETRSGDIVTQEGVEIGIIVLAIG